MRKPRPPTPNLFRPNSPGWIACAFVTLCLVSFPVRSSTTIERYPEAAALLRRLMRERGLPVPESTQPGTASPASAQK